MNPNAMKRNTLQKNSKKNTYVKKVHKYCNLIHPRSKKIKLIPELCIPFSVKRF